MNRIGLLVLSMVALVAFGESLPVIAAPALECRKNNCPAGMVPNVAGPKGPAGAPGPQGAKGAQGDPGQCQDNCGGKDDQKLYYVVQELEVMCNTAKLVPFDPYGEIAGGKVPCTLKCSFTKDEAGDPDCPWPLELDCPVLGDKKLSNSDPLWFVGSFLVMIDSQRTSVQFVSPSSLGFPPGDPYGIDPYGIYTTGVATELTATRVVVCADVSSVLEAE